MRLRAAALALPLLAMPVAAVAQADLSTVPGQTVISTITAPQMVSLLQARGYDVTFGVFDDGTPYLDSTYDGYFFSIYFDNCDGAKAAQCESFNFYIGFSYERPPPLSLANDYNSDWYFGKARILPDGTAVVEHMVDLYGGVTVDHVGGMIELWESIVDTFVDHLNAND